ncbi:TonB-dependent receptor [Pedobacter gandavensis]|uniref:TonB-dependent receptor plug domain-containing protein n=1 Tax=Pedobacter gandavensis TaxID=2679963 RepID=A0ABR6ESR1_9SPHI|nr:TonB-dependent receptor [Pedobacter gandavensis]MBB2148021.1 TonB-dependent receptor plug domain-containing protein [Pedobacter gandavensis]
MTYGKTLLLILFSTFSIGAFSQQNTSSISGNVKDGNELIIGASIFLKGTKQGVVSDHQGNYQLKNLSAGTYTVSISYIGFEKDSKQVVLKANQQLILNFSLKKDQQQLHDVNISGKTKTQQVKESGFSVNAIETKKYANTTADLNQILNRSTGVRIREQGGLGSDFKFSINGLSGKQVKFFIDGIPMDVMGSAMSLNNIPVNMAERLEVYKGVVPVQLGADAMGGAVNVITNQKASNYLDLSHSYGSFQTNRSSLTGQFVEQKTGLIIKGSGFFNSSENNYKMKNVDLVVGGTRVGNHITDVDGAEYVKGDAKRFHDNYLSALGQVEVGLTNKSWADVLFIGGGYNEGHQDLQTGFDQNTVYGKVRRTNFAKSATLRYKKNNLFTEGLTLSAFAARSKDTYKTTDTVFRNYNWDGSYYDKGYTEMGNSIKTINNIVRPRTYAMGNLSYVINNQHSLNLNYTIDHLKNENYNQLQVGRDSLPGTVNKQIIGFAYQQNLLDNKLSNTIFGKYYHLGLARAKYINGRYVKQDTTFSNFGYGIASRYKITEGLGVKASYEHSYRLQEAEELFGDGLNLQGNPDLKPESSHNLNLGAYYSFQINKSAFFFEASGFYRNAKDFIFPVPDVRSKLLKNENQSSVRITGFESEARYSYAQLLSLSLNLTYQSAVNTTKNGQTESYNVEGTYLNKIPNQPWLFGNADFTIGQDNLLGKDTRLQFNWFTQYVNWFYLTWESKGNPNGKSDIPTQFIHNASLSYSLQKGKYNISAECRNLTDHLAYDNFKLQKPGRSFSVKFRYFIQ